MNVKHKLYFNSQKTPNIPVLQQAVGSILEHIDCVMIALHSIGHCKNEP